MKKRAREADLKEALSSILLEDDWHRRALEALYEAGPFAWVTGGFVRNAIWDAVFGEQSLCIPADVDVIYLESRGGDPSIEKRLSSALRRSAPEVLWSVKDQGRMHLRSCDSPYRSLAEALCAFPDRSSAIAVRLAPTGQLEILAPFGLGDAFRGIVRPTPAGHCDDRYRAFLDRKLAGWRNRWPQLMVVSPSPRQGSHRKAA